MKGAKDKMIESQDREWTHHAVPSTAALEAAGRTFGTAAREVKHRPPEVTLRQGYVVLNSRQEKDHWYRLFRSAGLPFVCAFRDWNGAKVDVNMCSVERELTKEGQHALAKILTFRGVRGSTLRTVHADGGVLGRLRQLDALARVELIAEMLRQPGMTRELRPAR
jgi:hypothetical protein